MPELTMQQRAHSLINDLLGEPETPEMNLAIARARECYFWLLLGNHRIPGPSEPQPESEE